MRVGIYVIAIAVALLAGLLGIRLFLRWRRDRGIPELLIAIFFLGAGPFGFAPRVLPELVPMSQGMEAVLRVVSDVGLTLPSLTLALFTWYVFRRRQVWARLLVVGLILVVALGYFLGSMAYLQQAEMSVIIWLGLIARMGCFGWGCFESLRYYLSARRRMARDALTPTSVNRFLLWGIWSGAAILMTIFRVVFAYLYPADDPYTVGRFVSIALRILAGATCGTAVWFLFFPPAFYTRLIERSDRAQVDRRARVVS